jgi:hypothetical protein
MPVRQHRSPARKRDHRSRLSRDIRWGMVRGLYLTALPLLPALIVFLLEGPDQWWARAGLMFVRIIACYLGFGLAAGAIVGVCRPLLRWREASILFGGALGAIGVALLMFLPIDKPADRPAIDTTTVLFAAAIGVLPGSFLGWWLRRLNEKYGGVFSRDWIWRGRRL